MADFTLPWLPEGKPSICLDSEPGANFRGTYVVLLPQHLRQGLRWLHRAMVIMWETQNKPSPKSPSARAINNPQNGFVVGFPTLYKLYIYIYHYIYISIPYVTPQFPSKRAAACLHPVDTKLSKADSYPWLHIDQQGLNGPLKVGAR